MGWSTSVKAKLFCSRQNFLSQDKTLFPEAKTSFLKAKLTFLLFSCKRPWGQDRNQMFLPIFARGPWPETFKSSFSSRTNQTANKRAGQKKCVKIFLNFTYLHKTQPGQKLLEISRIFLKISTHQMFGYPDLDAGLNISWFLGVMAFPKAMRHSTLNNRNSGLETMAITIVIVLRTIPERQIFTFPIVLAIGWAILCD